jgi:hypothetical protein
MEGTGIIILMVLFGPVGVAYFVYGRKQKQVPALIAGMLLIALPYLVKNFYAVLITGIVLAIFPFIAKKYF